MQNLISLSAITLIGNEPRILDTDLATRLDYARPRMIRDLIARNRDELEAFGGLPYRAANLTNQGLHVQNVNLIDKGGRPGKAYYLNEGQALTLCALSKTPKAAEIRKALIDVFMAYRSGKLVHVSEHHRRPPSRMRRASDYDVAYERNIALLQAFQNDQEAMLSIIAGLTTRLDMLESKAA